MAESGSLTVYPSAYLASASTTGLSPSNTNTPVGKGADNTDGYAGFKYNSYYPLTAVYGFDVSAIPANAEIDSVSCTAGIYSPDGINANLYLYSGSTSIVSKTEYVTSGKRKKITVSGGAWTRGMLSDIRLVIKQTSNVGTQYNIRFYGADLTVTYTYQSEKFMLKLGGAWHDIARVFKKVNGIWVEQTDLANVIEDGVRYQNGGEIESTGPTPIPVTITGEGSSGYCYAKINGTTYTSATSGIEVMPGDTVVFCVSRFSGVNGTVTVDGSVVFTTSTQGPATYNWTVPDGISSINIALYESASTYHSTVTVATTEGDNSSANLISFTIAGTSYQAEDGMTWAEWVDSSYNTLGLYVGNHMFHGPLVFYDDGDAAIVDDTETYVNPTWLIAENHAYSLHYF